MKNKKLIIIMVVITLIVLLVGFFTIYKINLLSKYSDKNLESSFKDISNNYKIIDELTINTNIVDNYIDLDEVKIRNDFSNYEQEFVANEIERVKRYISKDDNSSYFSIGISIPYLDYYEREGFITNELYTNYNDRLYFLNKYKINNDIDLIKFIGSDKYKRNIFTSEKDLKGILSVYSVAKVFNFKNITLIKGDYEGFMYEAMTNVREVNLYKNGKRYIFMFAGNEFTKEKVQDLLNTIVID